MPFGAGGVGGGVGDDVGDGVAGCVVDGVGREFRGSVNDGIGDNPFLASFFGQLELSEGIGGGVGDGMLDTSATALVGKFVGALVPLSDMMWVLLPELLSVQLSALMSELMWVFMSEFVSALLT